MYELAYLVAKLFISLNCRFSDLLALAEEPETNKSTKATKNNKTTNKKGKTKQVEESNSDTEASEVNINFRQ